MPFCRRNRGGNMQEIFDWCAQLMEPGGRLVLNFILLENALEAAQIAEQMDWEDLEIVSVQASRWTGIGKGHYFKPQNPTIIVSCKKKKERLIDVQSTFCWSRPR